MTKKDGLGIIRVMNQQGQSFISRIITNSCLLYGVVWLYNPAYLNSLHGLWDTIMAFLIIGVIFSLLNAVVKPLITLLTLPAVLLTMGLFTLVINGLMIYLTAMLVPNLTLGLGQSILAGMIMTVANMLITNLFRKG